MRLHHVVAAGLLVVSLVACDPATVAPGASTPPTVAVGAVPSVPPIGVGGSTVDVAGMAEAATTKMCALLTADEAKGILGKDLVNTPNGMVFGGLGTNCIWQTDDTMAPGTFIKVEINPFPVKTNTDLLTLGGAQAVSVSVAGFDALGVDVGGLQKDASLVVRLADPGKPPSMLIQAPTLAMAKAVAEKVLGRLNSLK
jgi:hypothetical protein